MQMSIVFTTIIAGGFRSDRDSAAMGSIILHYTPVIVSNGKKRDMYH